MKLPSTLLLTGVLCTSGFAPKAFVPKASKVARFMGDEKVPYFAAAEKDKAENDGELSLDEEVEMLVQKDLAKKKLFSKLKTGDGVDYAPWMKISEEDEKEIRQVMREKAEIRRKRKEEQKSVTGNLYQDSTLQELSGTGLNSKIIGSDVELEWATGSEANTQGFIVKRRPAKTNDWKVVASFKDWGPLVSKGPDGGIYRYLDTDVTPGGWVYRVTECDNMGTESDMCQCLVEVQTEGEQRAALFAAVGIVTLGIAAVAAGLLLDPMGGY